MPITKSFALKIYLASFSFRNHFSTIFKSIIFFVYELITQTFEMAHIHEKMATINSYFKIKLQSPAKLEISKKVVPKLAQKLKIFIF